MVGEPGPSAPAGAPVVAFATADPFVNITGAGPGGAHPASGVVRSPYVGPPSKFHAPSTNTQGVDVGVRVGVGVPLEVQLGEGVIDAFGAEDDTATPTMTEMAAYVFRSNAIDTDESPHAMRDEYAAAPG